MFLSSRELHDSWNNNTCATWSSWVDIISPNLAETKSIPLRLWMFLGVEHVDNCMTWRGACCTSGFPLSWHLCCCFDSVSFLVLLLVVGCEDLIHFLFVSVIWLDSFQFHFSRWREPDVKFVLGICFWKNMEKQDPSELESGVTICYFCLNHLVTFGRFTLVTSWTS